MLIIQRCQNVFKRYRTSTDVFFAKHITGCNQASRSKENIELDKSRIGVSVGTNDDRYGEMSYFGN